MSDADSDRHGDLARPASIRFTDRVEWIDTDASGIYHWSTAARLAERAEADLYTALGCVEVFGRAPRVSVKFDFKRPLLFNQTIEVELRVKQLRRSTMTYAISIYNPDGLAVEGQMTACYVNPEAMRPVRIPDEIRRLLGEGGPQRLD